MGQMRFYAPKSESLPCSAVELAYLAGLEAIPWHSCNSLCDDILTIARTGSESGNLYIPWHVPGIGQRTLSTCTLMERERPYCLFTELARGTVHRARSMAADIDASGDQLSSAADQLLRAALAAFLAATVDSVDRQTSAELAIQHASHAIELLSEQVTETTLAEHRAEGTLSTMLLGRIDEPIPAGELADQFTSAFHAVSLPLRWRDHQPTADEFDWTLTERQLQWAGERALGAIAGPLIQLNEDSLPEWAIGMPFEQLEQAALRYVKAAMRQFTSGIDIWVCAGRLNVASTAPYTEEQKLRLAVATLEAAHATKPHKPIVMSFDQPWAEYLAAEDYDLSPLHFADALVRADLGVAGVAIEMNLGYWPHGTQPRDTFDISQHLDRWSLLGIPLLVYLTLPSHVADDQNATSDAQIVKHSKNNSQQPAMSQDQAQQLISVLFTKSAVHGVIWNQWSDAVKHEFPHGGLLDTAGCPKPLLTDLATLRQRHLP